MYPHGEEFESNKLSDLERKEKAREDQEIAPPYITHANTVPGSDVVGSRYDVATTTRTKQGAHLVRAQIISILQFMSTQLDNYSEKLTGIW